jgi:hypothetical protein
MDANQELLIKILFKIVKDSITEIITQELMLNQIDTLIENLFWPTSITSYYHD